MKIVGKFLHSISFHSIYLVQIQCTLLPAEMKHPKIIYIKYNLIVPVNEFIPDMFTRDAKFSTKV